MKYLEIIAPDIVPVMNKGITHHQVLFTLFPSPRKKTSGAQYFECLMIFVLRNGWDIFCVSVVCDEHNFSLDYRMLYAKMRS